MSGINKCIIVGRLGADPEVKTISGGNNVARLSVATSENWTDKEGEKQYDYSYVVQNFRFGAPGRVKREELAARRDEKELSALEAEI